MWFLRRLSFPRRRAHRSRWRESSLFERGCTLPDGAQRMPLRWKARGPQRQLAPSSGIQREVRRKSGLFSFLGCPGVSSSGPARRRRVHAPPPPPTPPGRKKSRNNSQEDRSRSRSCRGLKEKRRVHQEELRIASRAAKCCGTPACRPIRRNVRSRRRCRESPASRLRLCRLIPIGNSKSVNLGAVFVRSQTFAAFVPFPLEAGFPTDLK